MKPARVRFAPSPTGNLHIGGARTALYNFLLARQTGGQFILRIDDTDTKRCSPVYLEQIKEALKWLGLKWDEGIDVGGPHAPYNQLLRKEIYLEYAKELLDSGFAYRCFCSPERLQRMREAQQQLGLSPHYDGTCRYIDPADSEKRAAQGEKFTIRFKTPKEGSTTFYDLLRGEITVKNQNIDDYILVKSDGLALYHLASVVDDHLMGITHVFRGSEWLPTAPLHALIFRAFGWEEPLWIHLSVFLKPSGKGKMSKRDVTSEQSIFILGLRDLGYLPEAVNYWIALMGASFGADEEVLTLEEMIQRFDIRHLNPAPARVNFEKLDYLNGVYIRRLSTDNLISHMKPFLKKAGLEPNDAILRKIAPIIQTRIKHLDDAVAMAGFFFHSDINSNLTECNNGLSFNQNLESLREACVTLESLVDFDHATIEGALRSLADKMQIEASQLFQAIRIAVTGQRVSPPLIEIITILGRNETLSRLHRAIEQSQQLNG